MLFFVSNGSLFSFADNNVVGYSIEQYNKMIYD